MDKLMDAANALNLTSLGNGFVGEIGSYPYSLVYSDRYSKTGEFRFVFERSITKKDVEIIRRMGGTMFGIKHFARLRDTAVLPILPKGTASTDQYAKTLLRFLAAFVCGFQNTGLLPSVDCMLCHQSGEEDATSMRLFDGFYVPIHPQCAETLVAKVAYQVEREKKRWYWIPQGIVYAAIGGLIGMIPALIMYFWYMGTYDEGIFFGPLYALVPIVAVKGYRLSEAPKNAAMVVTTILVTILISVGFVFVKHQFVVERYDAPEFIGNLVFGVIGIVIAWRHVNETSKRNLHIVQDVNKQ